MSLKPETNRKPKHSFKHCLKYTRIRVFYVLHNPVFRLNPEIHGLLAGIFLYSVEISEYADQIESVLWCILSNEIGFNSLPIPCVPKIFIWKTIPKAVRENNHLLHSKYLRMCWPCMFILFSRNLVCLMNRVRYLKSLLCLEQIIILCFSCRRYSF